MIDHGRRRFDGDAADAAIDRAVREIMSSDAAPGFRQRVLARLDDRPRAVWGWGRLGLVASAAALVMLFAMWARTERPRDLPVTPTAPATAAQRADIPGSPPSPPTTTPPPPAERRTPLAVARRSAPAAAERRVTAASIDPAEEAVERGAATNPRPSVDATGAPPLQIRPLEVPEIVVKPVTIGPLVVMPLPPPRR